jgi:hypothetical protein
MDRGGSRDQRSGRQHGDTAFDQCASRVCASSAGGGTAEPFCQRYGAASRVCQPSHNRCRRDRCGAGAERRAGAIDESANGTIAEPERRGHLLVTVTFDRGAHQRVALQLRQCGQTGERLAHRDPSLEVGVRRDRALERLAELLVVIAGGTKRIDGRVVDDAVQPRPRVSHLGTALERQPGLQQALLERVVRNGLGQEQAAAVAQQLSAITLDQRLKGLFVPVTCGREQTLIRLRLQEANGDPGAHIS